MKQLYILILFASVSCFAMEQLSEEEQKQQIKQSLKKLHDSSKVVDFFAFYDLYTCIHSPDLQPYITNQNKTILQAAGLLNGDQLAPLVKKTFIEYTQEDEFKNTLLLPLDLE